MKKKNMDTEKFPMDPKYVKLDKGDSDEHIDVENSVSIDLSVSGSNDNLSVLILKMNTLMPTEVLMI